MAWGVKEFQLHLPDIELFPILTLMKIEFHIGILRIWANDQFCPGLFLKVQMAWDEVGVEMGQENMGYFSAMVFGFL